MFHIFSPPDFARAVAARPISYAAVLRMKPDSSSSVVNSRGRPQHYSSGLVTPDWPAFSSHPLSALSLHSSQEDYRSEGKTNGAVKISVCFLSKVFDLLEFAFILAYIQENVSTGIHIYKHKSLLMGEFGQLFCCIEVISHFIHGYLIFGSLLT